MAENIELTEGFLPLVTEGSIIGGKYDTRTPHLPENVALFTPAPSNYFSLLDGLPQSHGKDSILAPCCV